MTPPSRVVAVACLAVLLQACGGGGSDDGDGERVPTTIAIQTGNFQTAKYGTAVATAPAVLVTDAQGPIPGYPVSFAIASGGGAVQNASASTDANGVASPGTWTLGPEPGPNSITATAGTRTVTIAATALTGTPTTLTIETGNNQSATGGNNLATAPAVKVTDGAFGVQGVTVTWTVTQGGGSVQPATSTTNADGVATTQWRVGTGGGAQQMTASAAGLGPVTFDANAVPLVITSVVAVAGDAVSAFPGNFTPTLPVAEVRDQFGAPVPNVAVTFGVANGGGAVAFGSATTGENGRASPGAWRFGGAGAQQLTATVAGVVAPATFNGTVSALPASQFNIQLVFVDPQPTADQKAKFETARQRWQNIIVGDLPDIASGVPVNACGTPSETTPALPAVPGTVDDVVIFAGIRSIDGAGQILAQAGPCRVRSVGSLTVAGVVIFDEADLATLEGLGNGISDIAFHEIGHVLGFGTLWTDLNVIQFPGQPTVQFTGAAGMQAYAAAKNQANPQGAREVPVENTGGAGTRDGHWRETVFTNEIMTGFYNAGTNLFSAMSAASMRDLGYVVNDAATDAFLLPLRLGSVRVAGGRALGEQLAPWPIRVVDGGGTVVGELPR